MGSRVRGAASACVMAAGLFLCGLGGALAIAEPSKTPEVPGSHVNEDPGKGPKTDPDDGGGSATKTNEAPATDDGQPGNGGNPNNGNCGNDGSNGNAQGCGGGGSQTPPSPSPSTTASTESSTKTTTSRTTTTRSSDTTTSKETTSSETSETTTSTLTTGPGLPAPGGGGGGGGGLPEVPSGRPEVPEMQLPPAAEPSAIDVVPGVGAAAVELPIPPLTLPVIVAPPAGLGAGGGGAGAPAGPALPAAPRGLNAEPPSGREPLPASVGSNVAVPAASYRVGYSEYLRSAGLPQVAALAVPGVAGMLVLTGAGGLVGYRQAKAGLAVHTSGTARFVN